MPATLEVFSTQVVMNGDFNPAIFSPDWLLRNSLLGVDDATDATNSDSLVVTPDVARIETEWFQLQVVREQFVLNSKGPVTPAISDLVIGILSLIDQTPIRALGINFNADYKMSSADLWHKVGDVLAPKTVWNSFFPEHSNAVGLTNLAIEISPGKRGGESGDDLKRYNVSYSKTIPHGVSFLENNHFSIKVDKKGKTTAASLVVGLMNENWFVGISEAKKVFLGILTKIEGDK